MTATSTCVSLPTSPPTDNNDNHNDNVQPLSLGLSQAASQITTHDCLVTLIRILNNLLNDSHPKFRKLKTTNAAFARRVLQQPGGRPFLQACGFHHQSRDSGGVLELLPSQESTMHLWEARWALQRRADELHIKTGPMPVTPEEVSVLMQAQRKNADTSATSTNTCIKSVNTDTIPIQRQQLRQEGNKDIATDGVPKMADPQDGATSSSASSEQAIVEDLDQEIERVLMELPDLIAMTPQHQNLNESNHSRRNTIACSSSGGRDPPLLLQVPDNLSLSSPQQSTHATLLSSTGSMENQGSSLDELQGKIASALLSEGASSSVSPPPVDRMEKTKATTTTTSSTARVDDEPSTPVIHNKAPLLLPSDDVLSMDACSVDTANEEKRSSDGDDTVPVMNRRIAQMKERARARHTLRGSSRRLLAQNEENEEQEEDGNEQKIWKALCETMRESSVDDVFEPCWAALCKLSVLCSDLSLDGMGLPMKDELKFRNGCSERTTVSLNPPWLPYEVVELLWKAVLIERHNRRQPIAKICVEVYNALVDAKAVEVYKRREDDGDMPHLTWARIWPNSSLFRIGMSLSRLEEQSNGWIASLVNDLSDDMQLWYGRYALPMVVLGGKDGLEKVRDLLIDPELIQSRLDVVGVIRGVQRHVLDCQMYITRAQSAARKERLTLRRDKEHGLEVSAPIASIGVGLVLDACQQVATNLYRLGQMTVHSRGNSRQKLEIAYALHCLGMAVGQWGDYDFEMQLYVKSLKLHKDAGVYGGEAVADTLLCMGASNVSQGNLSAAMSCYEEAHDMFKAHLGNEHENVAKCLHAMGVIHCERDELDQAMRCFKASLKIRKGCEQHDRYDETTADTLCWIGRVYREKGSSEKALKYFEAALKAKEMIFGKTSLEVAEVLKNVAVILEDGQDIEKSLELYNRSLRIRRELLGDEHEDVCEVLTCVGNIYRDVGDTDMAAEIFRKMLELQRKVAATSKSRGKTTRTLIVAHEEVLDILMQLQMERGEHESLQDEIAGLVFTLGHLYENENAFEQSLQCFGKSLEVRRLRGDHAKTGKVLHAIGIAQGKRENYDDAMAAFDEALTIRKSILGENHMDCAETLHNMGNCAAKRGRLGDARVHYDESLRIKRSVVGRIHPSTAQTLHNIGNVLNKQQEYAAALKNYLEALAIRKSCLGEDHLEVAYSLHCIGSIRLKKLDFDDAKKNLHAAVRIKRMRLGKTHPSIAQTLQQLGVLNAQMGDMDEAVSSFDDALTIYKMRKDHSTHTAEVCEALGSLYEEKKEYSTALGCLEKALRARKGTSEDDAALAALFYKIGKAQRQLDLDHDALASFQSATRTLKKVEGRTSLDIANVLSDAGEVQMKLQQIAVARKCFAEALRIRRSLLHAKHPLIGKCLLDIGDVQVCEGHDHAAVESFKEAMDIFTNDTESHMLSESDTCYRLGSCYVKVGDFSTARDFFEQCLTMRVQMQPDTLPVAEVAHALGLVYFQQEDLARAEGLLRDSMEIQTRILGEDNLQVASLALALGRVCVSLTSPDEAMMYFEQALLIRQHHLDDSHLDCLEVNRFIGEVHMANGDHRRALSCWTGYLKVWRESVGDDETVADLLHSIGMAEYALQNYNLALKRFISSLALKRVLLGDENDSVANTLFKIGVTYSSQGEFKESIKYHKEAFRLRRRLFGEDHLSVAVSLDNIATLYMKQPNPMKALQSLKEALRIRTLNMEKHDLAIGTTLFGMGIIFAELDEVDKAMECYTASLAIRHEQLGDSSVEVAQTLHNIGTLYGKLRQYDQALVHWKQALVSYREAGMSDEQHVVAITIGNINMAESLLESQDDS